MFKFFQSEFMRLPFLKEFDRDSFYFKAQFRPGTFHELNLFQN